MKHCKKIAAVLLSFAVVAGVMPAGIVKAEDTVSITNINEFKSFTENCIYDDYSRNKKFVLQNDIDLTGVEVKAAEIFCGIFEGNGHSLKNVTLSLEGSNKGLFSSVSKEAELRDLNVIGNITIKEDTEKNTEALLRKRASDLLSRLNITSSEVENGTKGAGGIVGFNSGKIINCSYGGKISGQRQVGGIAGINNMTGIIDSCANGAAVGGESEIGGIAGYNEGIVKMSNNTGRICSDANEETKNAGGITGNNKGAVQVCTNKGEIGGANFGDNIGGISGKQSGELTDCINDGKVIGRKGVGGITGRFEPYTDIELSYESAKSTIEEQIDLFNNDVDAARAKIVDYAVKLLDGNGIITDILEALGIKKSDGTSRLDTLTDNASRLTNSATKMMDSVANGIDDATKKNVTDSLKDALTSLSDLSGETQDRLSNTRGLSDDLRNSLQGLNDLSEEAKNTLSDTNSSLNETLDSVNDFLDEFDGKGREITDTLDNFNEAIDKGQTDVTEIKDKLFGNIDSLEADIDDLQEKIDEAHSNLLKTMSSLRGASGSVSGFFDDIDDVVNNTSKELKRIKDRLEQIKKDVEKRINEARKRITATPSPTPAASPTPHTYSVEPDNTLESEYKVEPSIIGFLDSVLTTTAHAEKDDKVLIEDLKSTDTALPRVIAGEIVDTALVRSSINNAEIKGNEMVGGISGSVGFESITRSGENLVLPDGTKVNSEYVFKAVIDSCESEGKITAKSDYAGGIAGRCDLGNIRNSLTTGEIESEEGGYAGGVAGYTSGDIKTCIAINDLSGKSYVGGIAGSGKNIQTSYSLARIDESKEKSGAIAGYISGDVDGTYFIDEGLTGINGANLNGKAEAVKPSEIAVSDGKIPGAMSKLSDDDFFMATGDLYMPQIRALAEPKSAAIAAALQSKSYELSRFHFKVVFVDKDKELKSMTVDYGTKLNPSDIPRLTADGRDVPAWDKDVNKPIVRHTKFTSEYNRATSTLSSGEEPPVLLVEGIFDDGTEVHRRDEEVQRDFNGYKKGEAYSFTLSKPAYDKIKVHVRDERKAASKIAVEENGKWTIIDCKMDGSYAVFEVGAPCKFIILYGKKMPNTFIIIVIGIIVIGIAGFVIFRGVKNGRKNGRKEKKDV